MLDTIRAANRALGRVRLGAAAVALSLLVACGGGGGGGPVEVPQSCSPNNPFRADATGPVVNASLAIEKQWVGGYVNDVYLWYDTVPNVNPADPLFSVDTPNGFYTSIDEYFLALTRPLTNPPGKPVDDRFSFTYPTRLWDQLINSGSNVGFGIEWYINQPTNAPREIRVAFVHKGSVAESRGILRGDTLVLADGVSAQDTTQNGVDVLNAALTPASGTSHTFRFSRAGVSGTTDYTMPAGSVSLTSVDRRVLNVNGRSVGYLLFNDHVLTAERDLIDSVALLKNAGVTDLVLDLRYNTGGYLYLASELAYMIAGRQRTENKSFENTMFNNKQSGRNSMTPFFDLGCVPDPSTFECTTDEALPTLGPIDGINTVYVLTSADTCSASEAIINGLRGIDVDVRVIGSTTCGKPYGFFGESNCGITYFPIEFQAVNHKGYGDYVDGFAPDPIGNATNLVRGCDAADDLSRPLGDPAEGQLATALYHLQNNGACPPLALSREGPMAAGTTGAHTQGRVVKPAPLSNRNARMPVR